MDSFEELSAIRFIVAIGVLAYASLLDVRTRKVPNKYWIALSIFGLAMIVIQIASDRAPVEYLLVAVPILAILSDIYISGKEGSSLAKYDTIAKYALALAFIVLIGVLWGGDLYLRDLLAVPVMMLLIVVLYMLDAIRGGADAKALVALAIVFPSYPSIGLFPVITRSGDFGDFQFPFAFVVLITAAIIVALTPLWFLLRNASRGDLQYPQSFFGYRMNVNDAEKKHVWLMERMEEGKHVTYTRPRREENLGTELKKLSEAGHVKVWVTPKIPFMVPLLLGLAFAATVGNLLRLLFPL